MQDQDPLVEFATVKAELDVLFKDRKLWMALSVLLSLWLLPYGLLAFLVGCGMFFAGTRFFRSHLLSKITEHQLYVVACKIKDPEDE